MTSPSGRPVRIDPDDLARRVADRLAHQGHAVPDVANRIKFIGTSAVAGLFITALAGVLIFAVVFGIGWLAGAATPDDQLAQGPGRAGPGLGLVETTTTLAASAMAAEPPTTTLGVPFLTTTTEPPSFSPIPTLPRPSQPNTVVVVVSTTTSPSTSSTHPSTTTTTTTSDTSVDSGTFTMPGYVYLDGSGYITTPDNNKYTPIETYDLRADYALDDGTPTTLQTLISHWAIGTSNASIMWDIQPTSAPKPGNFNIELASADGSTWRGNFATLASSTELPTADGERKQFRTWFDRANASGDKEIRFHHRTGFDPLTSGSWTETGTQDGVSQTGAHTYKNVATPLAIGANNNGTGNRFIGKVYRAAMYVDGVLVADVDFTTAAQTSDDGLTFVDSVGNVWTLQGTAIWVAPGGE